MSLPRLIRTAACGLLAGAIGTLAMDGLWYLRYKRGGGESDFLKWELASAPANWNDASAPANVGKLLYETTTRAALPESAISATTNVMHWSYGSQWGVVLAVAVGSGRQLRIWQAP